MYLLVSLCDPGWTYFFFLPQHLLVATPSEPNSNRSARANDGTAVGSLENEFLPFESGTLEDRYTALRHRAAHANSGDGLV